MNQRQENLLQYIVEDYLSNAQPVGSQYVAHKHKVRVSPATIRNEMAQLEEEGHIYQPHTSAGRLPTMQGLTYYVQHLLKPVHITGREVQRLDDIFTKHGLRGLAKMAASLCHSACILAQNNSNFYYTGFSHLFSQPECADASLVYAIGRAIDKLESVLPQFMDDEPGSTPKIYLGDENPLGHECTAMVIGNNRKKTLFGILSPLRTNYNRTLGILTKVAEYV